MLLRSLALLGVVPGLVAGLLMECLPLSPAFQSVAGAMSAFAVAYIALPLLCLMGAEPGTRSVAGRVGLVEALLALAGLVALVMVLHVALERSTHWIPDLVVRHRPILFAIVAAVAGGVAAGSRVGISLVR